MKIFSNFDTKLRQKIFEEYKLQYAPENVLCFGRSKLYYIVKVGIPFTVLLLINIFALIFFYKWLGGDYFSYILMSMLIMDIVFLFPIVGKYIDYKMDFIIVIPNSIIMYEQEGLFKRNVSTISTQSVKTITIKKSGLLYSIFDNGDIIVLTEGDNEHVGEIKFRWIPRPDKRRNQIVRVIGLDLEADQNPK